LSKIDIGVICEVEQRSRYLRGGFVRGEEQQNKKMYGDIQFLEHCHPFAHIRATSCNVDTITAPDSKKENQEE
jgi:hypothetical protein